MFTHLIIEYVLSSCWKIFFKFPLRWLFWIFYCYSRFQFVSVSFLWYFQTSLTFERHLSNTLVSYELNTLEKNANEWKRLRMPARKVHHKKSEAWTTWMQLLFWWGTWGMWGICISVNFENLWHAPRLQKQLLLFLVF